MQKVEESLSIPDWRYYLNTAGSELPIVPVERISEVVKNLDDSITPGLFEPKYVHNYLVTLKSCSFPLESAVRR